MGLAPFDARVRHAVYQCFARGDVPRAVDVAAALDVRIDEVRAGYDRLAAAHVLVLDPASREVWMAIPFSAVPTDFRVDSAACAWYANCAWDAFGIPAAVGGDARITTRCRHSGAPLEYGIEHGALSGRGGAAHFLVPAAQWWDDIGYT